MQSRHATYLRVIMNVQIPGVSHNAVFLSAEFDDSEQGRWSDFVPLLLKGDLVENIILGKQATWGPSAHRACEKDWRRKSQLMGGERVAIFESEDIDELEAIFDEVLGYFPG